jgi:hypothetical protein
VPPDHLSQRRPESGGAGALPSRPQCPSSSHLQRQGSLHGLGMKSLGSSAHIFRISRNRHRQGRIARAKRRKPDRWLRLLPSEDERGARYLLAG